MASASRSLIPRTSLSCIGSEKAESSPVRPQKAGSENVKLVREYQRTGDTSLLERIIDRNQGLLHSVLRRLSYLPDPYEDLLQVANLGLIKAVRRYQASRGVEFSSYAMAMVDGEVRHYLRDNMLMRQPRWLRKAQKNIERGTIELTRKLQRRPTLKELANEVNISEEGVLEILVASAGSELYFDDSLNNEGLSRPVNSGMIRAQYHESFSLPIEDRIALEEAMRTLSSFHKKIVYLLFYKDLTQSEVAKELGLNQRKVSRESAKALNRLKAILNTKVF